MTICSTGLNMEAVRRAFYNDFAKWRITKDQLGDKELLNAYMEEKYAMSPGEGNILETIKAMNSPPMGEEEEKGNTAAVTSNVVACSKKSGNHAARKKRSAEGRG